MSKRISYVCYRCKHNTGDLHCDHCINGSNFERKTDMNTYETTLEKLMGKPTLKDRIRDYAACHGCLAKINPWDMKLEHVPVYVFDTATARPVGTVYMLVENSNDDVAFEDFTKKFDELYNTYKCKPYLERALTTSDGKNADYVYLDESETRVWKRNNPYISPSVWNGNKCYKRINPVPDIEKVYFNNPVTVVIWADGTKTIVRAQSGEEYDPEKGLAMAIAKKALGNKGNYYNTFTEWQPVKKEEKRCDICEAVEEVEAYEVVEPARKEGSE